MTREQVEKIIWKHYHADSHALNVEKVVDEIMALEKPCPCDEGCERCGLGVKCICACHENILKRPYKHDSKCCDDMNGEVEKPVGDWHHSVTLQRQSYLNVSVGGLQELLKSGVDTCVFYEENNKYLPFTPKIVADKSWNAAIEAAKEAVPEKLKATFFDPSEPIIQGHNDCRTQTLENLDKLKK